MGDEAVIEQLTEKQTELIKFLYVDYNGLTRGKVIPLASLKAKLTDGIGLTKATLNVSGRDTILLGTDMTPIGNCALFVNRRRHMSYPICRKPPFPPNPWILLIHSF